MAMIRQIDGVEALEAAAEEYGLLPFFCCGVPGYSVEDLNRTVA